VTAVLVTGGAGYIGSHAVKTLRKAGHQVLIYDNFLAGHRAAAESALGSAGGIIDADIRDTARLTDILKSRRIAAVMHFAASLSVGASVRDPAGYYANNVIGALSVLQAMVSAGVRTLVFSSTAAVFGNPEQTPIMEDHPRRPINPYGETKLAVERALPHYERAYGVRSVALRYFNAAGADPDGDLGEDHDPEEHVIPRALDAALGRGSFQVFGDDYDTPDGTCLRDYVHVTDLAEAHVLALDSLVSGGPSAIYNLGNGRPTSVRQVVDAVKRVTGKAVPYTQGPRRPGDPAVLYASSERIKKELGWRPRYEEIDTIVETAWRWREAHPAGYRVKAGR
jgi:UDP-glucose-4-epimerase GalE